MRIVLNGKPETMAEVRTLNDLLELRRPRPPFAIEINKRLVRRKEYDDVRLCEGDRVEIVTLVGGG
ncbi:MAG: sulfur carrier protein ThiS [Phycisphaerae bacterium]